jgi:hypothetical protein
MKRTNAFWAAASLCLVTLATTAFAQDEPPRPPGQPPDSATVDTLATKPVEEAAPAAAAAPDTVAAGARARRAPTTARTIHPVFSLGIGSAVNYQPDSFADNYDPSFGVLLSGGVRRGPFTLAASFDYNFFFASGTTPNDLNVLTVFADFKYSPLSGAARPYLLVCGGLYRTWIVDEDYTEVVLGYGGGAGVELKVGETRRLFLEGRYIQGQTRERTEEKANTEVIPVRFGLTWEIQ